MIAGLSAILAVMLLTEPDEVIDAAAAAAISEDANRVELAGQKEAAAKIEAKNCVVDRFSKSGWAEGLATVTHGKTVFRGTGVYFSSPEGYVKVVERTDVDSKDLKFGGAL